jgi:hypothetical protein
MCAQPFGNSAASYSYAVWKIMEKSVNAEVLNQTIKAEVDLPADRFWVRDQNGDDVQVRLEPNGTVYLGYTKDNRRTIESREISFAAFVVMFREFVRAVV